MEEEIQHLNNETASKKVNIFASKKGKLIAASVGIASLLAACNFQGSDNNTEHVKEPTPSVIEQPEQLSKDEQTIVDWQKEAKERLEDHSKMLSDEELIEEALITAGKNRGQLEEYQRNGGVLVTAYAGQLDGFRQPTPIMKLPINAVIHNALVRQGENMISSITNEEVEYKFMYFKCGDVEGNIADLENNPVTENLDDVVCVIPLDYASPAPQSLP